MTGSIPPAEGREKKVVAVEEGVALLSGRG